MDFYRAREADYNHIKYEKSKTHNTALIASEGSKTIGVLEYEIKDMKEAEIINFGLFGECGESVILQGLINEIIYWNPYLKSITYKKKSNAISEKTLLQLGFCEENEWILKIYNDINPFKVRIDEITPEQLTVDADKLARVSSWIEKPEDIVVCCIRVNGRLICIDGYSRLVAAYKMGFEHVYAYIDNESDNTEFYLTCLKWCHEQGVQSIKDLADRVVTPAEHERLWINRCQAYFKEQSDND